MKFNWLLEMILIIIVSGCSSIRVPFALGKNNLSVKERVEAGCLDSCSMISNDSRGECILKCHDK
jgi:hypothetical protein